MNTRSIRFRMALWYAALLAGALILFGAASYIGLERYLQKSLEESLIKQARSIGKTIASNIPSQKSKEKVEVFPHSPSPMMILRVLALVLQMDQCIM